MSEAAVTASDWIKGIALSVLASVIGGASKLSIRKSWLMVENLPDDPPEVDASIEGKSKEDDGLTRKGWTHGSLGCGTGCGEEEDGCNSLVVLPEVELAPGRRGEDGRISAVESSLPSFGSASEGEEAGRNGTGLRSDGDRTNSSSISTDSAGYPKSGRNLKRIRRTAYALRISGMIGMTFLNPLCCVLAMNYASPSILAPFSGLTLVWIVAFSGMLIGEKPSGRQIGAASLIVAGEVIVAVFGDHTNDVGVTTKDVKHSYKDPYFILYFVLMAVWMLVLAEMMTSSHSGPIYRRFAWGVSGGSITGFQNFLKDTLTIVKASSAADESYPWCLYLMVALAAASAFGGLLLLTACMKRYDATFSAAMFVGSFVISASIMSAVHYQTFANLEDVWNYVMYPVGLVVLMAGVVVLVLDTKDGAPEGDVTNACRRTSFEMKEPLVPPTSCCEETVFREGPV